MVNTSRCTACGVEIVARSKREIRAFCSKECRYGHQSKTRVRPIADRFWEKVDVRAKDECWPWTGATTFGGYGVLGSGGHDGAVVRAHRLSYELHFTPIPNGLVIRHKCDNPSCVNPSHLETGTQKENMQDSVRRGRAAAPKRKISDSAVSEIISDSGTVRDIAQRYGISPGLVSRIKNGKIKYRS